MIPDDPTQDPVLDPADLPDDVRNGRIDEPDEADPVDGADDPDDGGDGTDEDIPDEVSDGETLTPDG